MLLTGLSLVCPERFVRACIRSYKNWTGEKRTDFLFFVCDSLRDLCVSVCFMLREWRLFMLLMGLSLVRRERGLYVKAYEL